MNDKALIAISVLVVVLAFLSICAVWHDVTL